MTPSGVTQMLERRAGIAGLDHVNPHMLAVADERAREADRRLSPGDRL